MPSRSHWEIDELERFVEELGQEMSDRIASLELDLLPVEYETEADFMTRVGHRNMARLCAEEIVPTETLPAPDVDDDDDDDELPYEWQIPSAQETAAAVIADEGDVRLTHRPR